MQTIARIALATLALYIILQIIKSTISSLFFIGHAGEVPITVLVIGCLGVASLIALAIIIAHQLLIKGDKWALRIISYSEENQPQISPHWLPATYHLVSVLAGILFLYWTIPAFFALLSSFYLKIQPSYGPYLSMSPKSYFWPRFASFGIRLALTLYLLCGAPHFVRWQVKKTLEQCNNQLSTVNN